MLPGSHDTRTAALYFLVWTLAWTAAIFTGVVTPPTPATVTLAVVGVACLGLGWVAASRDQRAAKHSRAQKRHQATLHATRWPAPGAISPRVYALLAAAFALGIGIFVAVSLVYIQLLHLFTHGDKNEDTLISLALLMVFVIFSTTRKRGQ